MAHASGIFVQPVAKALIGDVDHRGCTGGEDQFGDLFPLRQRQIGPGRVVATAVQQHDVIRPDPGEISFHAVEIDPACGIVEIAVRFGRDIEIFQDRRMVRPGRIADPDRGIRVGHLHKLEKLPDSAGTAGGLRPDDTVREDPFTEYQITHCRHEAEITQQPDIGFGGLGLQQPLLCCLDCPHHGRLAGFVLVDPDTEIDFRLTRVFGIHADQLDDLVGGLWCEVLEHGYIPMDGCRGALSAHATVSPDGPV